MPKKVKTEENDGVANAAEKPAPRARRRPEPAEGSTSSRKKTAAKSAKPRQSSPVIASAAQPTDEEIRMRAYFIAERRQRFDLSGDADSDWLEAKRQLLSETGPR